MGSVQTWRRLFPFLRPYTWHIVGLSILLLANASAAMVMIPVARYAGEVFSNLTLEGLNRLILAAIAGYALKSLFTWLSTLMMGFVSIRAVADLREVLFSHLQRQSLDFHDRHKSGDTASRLVTDVNAVRDALAQGAAELIPNTLILIAALGYLFTLNWRLALLTVVGMPIVGWAISLFASRLRLWSLQAQGKSADILAYLNESLAATATIKSFNREDFERRRFVEVNDSHFLASFRGEQVWALQMPTIAVLQVLALAGVLWVGGWEMLQGRLAMPDLMAFAAAVGICVEPIQSLSNGVARIQRAIGAAERVFAVIDEAPSITDRPDARPLEAMQGEIRFDGVQFTYPNGHAGLLGLDLAVRPGEALAVVGASGSGKSTLAKLLLRFYDPTSGAIMLDGTDLRDLPLAWLRDQIAYVPQETPLFAGSLLDNIRYGRLDATDEEVVEAAIQANAHGFITQLPDGYQSVVGERGSTLSGGQRQRIAIARAILKDPRILLLDEATSALDAESEAVVQEALERLMAGRTTILITHRLKSATRADRVVVIDEGRALEMGTPEQLMQESGAYRSLYQHWSLE
ncbi:putative multidrug export ATP-binding/permease protein [compost metagenome]